MSDPLLPRRIAQIACALLCVWIGVEFHLFVRWGMSGGPYHPRPPGVEGFLPISALMSLKFWASTGIVDGIHPAAPFILLAVIGTGLLLKKSFCSWLCPIGTLSEALWMGGRRLFGRNLALPRRLDWPLRSLKYLLLFFFVQAIWRMDVGALAHFLHSPYHKLADVKMYLFFAEISRTASWIIVVLMALSVVVKNFWCRYLCPYGALLGLTGFPALFQVIRSPETCIDCRLCTKACPSRIRVHQAGRVWSDECTSCLRCAQACPVPGTLEVRAGRSGPGLSAWALLALLALTFMGITGAAKGAGHWHTRIGPEEYRARFARLHTPVYEHSRGRVPAYGPGD